MNIPTVYTVYLFPLDEIPSGSVIEIISTLGIDIVVQPDTVNELHLEKINKQYGTTMLIVTV